MEQLTREEIEQKKRERATAKRMMQDSLRWWVGFQSVPSIMIMVGTLVGSAYYLKSEALAVVTGLVATVTMGLINVLQQMTAPPEKESEMSKAMTETHDLLRQQLKKKSGSVVMDRNKIEWNNEGMNIEGNTPEHPVYGDDKPLTKNKKER